VNKIIELHALREKNLIKVEIRPDAEELKALAKRLEVLEVKEFTANVTLKTNGPELYRLTGNIKAKLNQACGVTLVPVPETIDEHFDETLTTSAALLAPEEETDGDINQPVDLIEGDNIDVYEIVTQWLTLCLEPYPRSNAPHFEHTEIKENPEGVKLYKPFEGLATLKDK
jgi:uncharacterized metal-binding protein YceD (DUF177 family)